VVLANQGKTQREMTSIMNLIIIYASGSDENGKVYAIWSGVRRRDQLIDRDLSLVGILLLQHVEYSTIRLL
jgi:hypothetical protein